MLLATFGIFLVECGIHVGLGTSKNSAVIHLTRIVKEQLAKLRLDDRIQPVRIYHPIFEKRELERANTRRSVPEQEPKMIEGAYQMQVFESLKKLRKDQGEKEMPQPELSLQQRCADLAFEMQGKDEMWLSYVKGDEKPTDPTDLIFPKSICSPSFESTSTKSNMRNKPLRD